VDPTDSVLSLAQRLVYTEVLPDAPEGPCRKCPLGLSLHAPAWLRLCCPDRHNSVGLVDGIPLDGVEGPFCGSY